MTDLLIAAAVALIGLAHGGLLGGLLGCGIDPAQAGPISVPEPGALAVLSTGLVGALLLRRRNRD